MRVATEIHSSVTTKKDFVNMCGFAQRHVQTVLVTLETLAQRNNDLNFNGKLPLNSCQTVSIGASVRFWCHVQEHQVFWTNWLQSSLYSSSINDKIYKYCVWKWMLWCSSSLQSASSLFSAMSKMKSKLTSWWKVKLFSGFTQSSGSTQLMIQN